MDGWILMCPCLKPLDEALKATGVRETFRGQAWSKNCREWVYYPMVLKRAEVRESYHFPETVTDHEHLGTHEGAEAGFICTLHQDAIMGEHPKQASTASRVFPG